MVLSAGAGWEYRCPNLTNWLGVQTSVQQVQQVQFSHILGGRKSFANVETPGLFILKGSKSI